MTHYQKNKPKDKKKGGDMSRRRVYTARAGYRGIRTCGLRLTPVIEKDNPRKELDWIIEVESDGWWRVDDLEVLFKRDPGDTGCTGKAMFNIELADQNWKFVEDVDGKPLDGMRPCNGSAPLDHIIHTCLSRDRKTLLVQVECLEANAETMEFMFQWVAELGGVEYCSADPAVSIPPPEPK